MKISGSAHDLNSLLVTRQMTLFHQGVRMGEKLVLRSRVSIEGVKKLNYALIFPIIKNSGTVCLVPYIRTVLEAVIKLTQK